MISPRRLHADFKEKVWGATDLSPWYPDSTAKIGEVWFTESLSGQPDLPLLAKFIFTSANLSVQVHPGDQYAAEHEHSPGKTEMWYVLRAAPGARLALGFREPITKARLIEASLSGEIERLLRWYDASPGDTYFVPAGTVHAIGAGLAVCEIQQQSDVTYRLYDYGRPRELHLERGAAVADLGSHPGRQPAIPQPDGSLLLADCRYFRTELLPVVSELLYTPRNAGLELLIVLQGSGVLAGQAFQTGEGWLVPAGAAPFLIAPHVPCRFLRAFVPQKTG